MYNTNIILKTILTLIFIVVSIFIQNYYLFWIILFYQLLLCIVDRNMKSLIILFFMALLLLFIYFTRKIRILTIGLVIINFLVLYITSFNKRNLWKLRYFVKYKSANKRKELFRDNFKSVIDARNKEKLKKYEYENVDELLVKKNDSDIKDMYNYSRVRFYGYDTTTTSLFESWSLYDLFILVVSAGVLFLIFMFWG